MKPKPPTRRRRILGNPLLQEQNHDPYRAQEKLRQATTCPQCGARYRNGRWTWPESDSPAFRSELCPACRRINDDYPAGEIRLSGSFLIGHADEVLATVQHVAEQERRQHPLHRIMAVETDDEDVVILTTDIHLPHRLAHALRDAWGGAVSQHYDPAGYFARARWERND